MYQISNTDCEQMKAILRSFCSERGNTLREQELRRKAVLLRKKLERKRSYDKRRCN